MARHVWQSVVWMGLMMSRPYKFTVDYLVPVPCAPESQCYEGCVVKQACVLAFFCNRHHQLTDWMHGNNPQKK